MFASLKTIIRNYLADRLRVPSVESSMVRLAAAGFSPVGVYDVGAFRGDFAETVLKLWPKSRVTCFEPQESQIPNLNCLASRFASRVIVKQCLLGERNVGEVDFYVGETASSVLAHSADAQYPTIKLPMVTLDTVRAESGGMQCTLLKLDVQGYELNVLRGAEHLLKSEVEVILAELNFLDIYAGASLMHETVEWLAERRFIAYDIGGIIRRPLDDALWQADFVFVRENSQLRTNKHWANPIQGR